MHPDIFDKKNHNINKVYHVFLNSYKVNYYYELFLL